jgi:selenobiotic family peptide radical SAM maturase
VSVSLLGNPIEPAIIERLLAIRPPAYYQVSLEGLEAHNDEMRGPGHFAQTMSFLDAARERGLRTIVMLTLTRENLDQVIPLGDALAGLTSRFTFNRVSQVGEAQDLEAPTPDEFASFLRRYLEARRRNPVFGVKENLFSLVRDVAGKRAFRGCTGYGCGAAFNFLAVMPDGEVHACRKFPSPVGNIRQDSLDLIYDSQAARGYRRGSTACEGCHLRRVCGGCLASSHSAGLDPLRDRDPYCFASPPALHTGFGVPAFAGRPGSRLPRGKRDSGFGIRAAL